MADKEMLRANHADDATLKDEMVRLMSLAIEDIMAKRDNDEPTMQDCVDAAVHCYELAFNK